MAAITGENVVDGLDVDTVKTWVANDVFIDVAKVELPVGVNI